MTTEANTPTIEAPNLTPTGTEGTTPVDLGAGSPTSTTASETTPAAVDLGASVPAAGEPVAAADTPPVEGAENFGAPEADASYEVTGLPEGMTIDTEALSAITPVARELGLSNLGLSKIAGVYAEKVLPAVQAQAIAGIEQQIVAQRAVWEGEARDVISGKTELKDAAGSAITFDGNNVDHVMKTAAKGFDKLAPQGFREFLSETGLATHPMMVAFAYKVGQQISEDTNFEGGKTAMPKSRTEKYYG